MRGGVCEANCRPAGQPIPWGCRRALITGRGAATASARKAQAAGRQSEREVRVQAVAGGTALRFGASDFGGKRRAQRGQRTWRGGGAAADKSSGATGA